MHNQHTISCIRHDTTYTAQCNDVTWASVLHCTACALCKQLRCRSSSVATTPAEEAAPKRVRVKRDRSRGFGGDN